MSTLWVLLELVSLAGLVVLICVAVFLRSQSGPSGPDDENGEPDWWPKLERENDDPDWWPEFEREFARYVTRQEAARRAESALPPRLRRSRGSD